LSLNFEFKFGSKNESYVCFSKESSDATNRENDVAVPLNYPKFEVASRCDLSSVVQLNAPGISKFDRNPLPDQPAKEGRFIVSLKGSFLT
jgi:hypothetical protein